VIGLFPAVLVSPLARAAGAWARLRPAVLAPAAERAAGGALRVSAIALALLALTAGLVLLRRRLARGRPEAAAETWGCGFAAPTARIQYTGSSFAELLLARFSWVVRPHGERPQLHAPFPGPAAFRTHVPDAVLDLALLPAARGVSWLATGARLANLRRIHFQALLLLATLVAMLAWGFLS
jgi:hypothetical protein